MQSFIIALASKIALDLLKSATHGLWEGFWAVIFDGIKEAELAWKGSGQSEAKKKYVLNQIFQFIDRSTKMNFVQKWAMKTFCSRVIDLIVERLNTQLGQSWVAVVGDIKKYLEDKIPYVKD